MKKLISVLALVAFAAAGCGEATAPAPIETAEWTNDESWRSLPNADLVTGTVIYRKNVESFVFESVAPEDIEFVDADLLYVRGEVHRRLAGAKDYDLLWTPDLVLTIESVRRGPEGSYVRVRPFELIEYVWGDFEIDTGEAFTRGMMAEAGLWTPEGGYVIPPEVAYEMTPSELDALLSFQNGDYDVRLHSQRANFTLGTIELTRDFNFGKVDNRDVFKLGLKGTVRFPVEVEGVVRLRAYKEDAFLWFDADIDVSSEASNGEYPRCFNGRTDRTCVDQVLVKFVPGLDVGMEAKLSATLIEFFESKLDGDKHPILRRDLAQIPLGAFLKLKPNFFIKPVAEASANATIDLTGSINGQLRYPLGLEYFGDWHAARALCGSPCYSADCGCQVGANMLPNARHRATFQVDKTASISEAVGTIEAKLGVKFGLGLGISPSVGVVTIDGIEAGMKLLGEGKFMPFRFGTSSSDPCLKLEGKAVPYAALDARLRWDLGKKGELFKIATAEFDVTALSLGRAYENNSFCVDLTPRNQVVMTVTNANTPSGRRDLNGYEVDAVWVTRPSDGRVIRPNNAGNSGYPADGKCDAAGNWFLVDNFTGSKTWTFGENLRPGDIVHVQRITDDFGGACQPSGTAEVFVSGGGAQRRLGTADNSSNSFTFTLQTSDFL